MKTKYVTRKIKVTKTDIAKGVRNEPTMCPIARAVHRSFRNAKFVIVEDSNILIDFGDRCLQWAHESSSLKINDFIVDFDAGKPVKPFTFTFKGE